MTTVDKSGLPGKFGFWKAWIYQYGVGHILWPLLVYEFSMSAVEGEEFMVTCEREVLQYRESTDPKVS